MGGIGLQVSFCNSYANVKPRWHFEPKIAPLSIIMHV